MANEIRTKLDAWVNFTITTASLATASAFQSSIITNSNNRPAALIDLKMQSGAAPTNGTVYELFLIRGDGTNRDDNAGTTNAAITIENAPLLGTLVVTSAGAPKNFQRIFDTSALGKLGSEFGIAVRNSTGQTSNAAQQAPRYALYLPEIQ